MNKSRLQNVDLLRAIAIIAVMLYHFSSRVSQLYPEVAPTYGFPVGYLGVDVFFVVSGYCILLTLNHSKDVLLFWAKRIARLQPVYTAGAILTFTVVSAFGLPGREVSISSAIGNLVWLTVIPNWPRIDGAYWSLIVELKFYFWVGIIYGISRGRSTTIAWLVFCIIGALSRFLPSDINLNSIFISDYAPSFLAGMAAYEAKQLGKWNFFAALFAAALLLYVSPQFKYDGPLLIFVTYAAVALLLAPELRVPRPIIYIGLISYPVYVVHQNIGYVVMRIFPGSGEVRAIIALASALALGAVLHWAFDTRFQKPIADWIYRSLKAMRKG